MNELIQHLYLTIERKINMNLTDLQSVTVTIKKIKIAAFTICKSCSILSRCRFEFDYCSALLYESRMMQNVHSVIPAVPVPLVDTDPQTEH